MSYTGNEASTAVPNSLSGTVGSRDLTSVTLMDSCMCGCDDGACIPQREYRRKRTDPTPRDQLQEMIVFKVNGKCGYPLIDALRGCYTGLDGRDDRMFVGSKSSISMRLEWLPYGKWSSQIRTLNWRKSVDYISRAKLATEVAKRMKLFFEQMQYRAADPSHTKYRVLPGIIDIDHLELVALQRVAQSSYMPHFRLIPPS